MAAPRRGLILIESARGNKEVSLRFILAILICCFGCAPSTQAARLSVAGVANSSEPHAPGVDYTAKTAYGAGVLLELRMIPLFGLEFGALMVPRRFEFNRLTPVDEKVTVEGKMYEFPVLLRAHLGRTFSLGVGAYYARATGEITNQSVTAAGSSTSNHTYQSQNETTTDYGAVTSAALSLRMAALTYFLLDARYTIGTKNTSTIAGSDRKYNDIQLLAGLQLGF